MVCFSSHDSPSHNVMTANCSCYASLTSAAPRNVREGYWCVAFLLSQLKQPLWEAWFMDFNGVNTVVFLVLFLSQASVCSVDGLPMKAYGSVSLYDYVSVLV